MRRTTSGFLATALLVSVLPLAAQESSPGGWRRFGDPAQNAPATGDPAPPPAPAAGQDPAANPPAPPPPPPASSQQVQPWQQNQGPQGQGLYQVPPSGPVTFTIPSGTWVTVRTNQVLSSNHNQTGDAFTGSLLEPIVVNGKVIARRGQMVGGRVVEALKAGRVKGTSSLHLELTELGIADGQQVPIKTQMVDRRGSTSVGRDVAAVGATTGLGAAIGAGAAGGFGAGMGAIGGAVVSGIGVLVTRGHPTVIYPETALTFRLENPVTVTGDSYAFAPAQQYDYTGAGAGPRGSYGPGYGPGPRAYAPGPYRYAPYPYPYPYAYAPYPYFYGPTLFFGYRGGWGRRW